MALAMAASSAAWAQTAIPASFAHPRSTATAANRGFAVRVVQAYKDAGTLANSNARTEAQLAGTLINPLTGLPFADVTDKTGFSADGVYTETAAIDYEKGGGASGPFPGVPSTSDNTDNIALEAVAYLDLDPGTYTMIVNSDDGFRVTAGPDSRDQLTSIKLGEYDGGRGAGDTSFTFSVSAAGIYSFRLTYEQGGGGANVSWFAAPSTAADPHVLVNAADGIKAYSTLVGGVAPYVALANPLPGATGVSPATVVNFVLVDGTPAKVNPASVALYFDGVKTASTASKAGSKTTISYDPPGLLDVLSKHTVKLTFADDATPANLRTNEFTFESAAFGNIKLPAPIYLENFDSIAEGTLPAGWTAENHTDTRTEGLDLNNPNSDSYLGWAVISSNRMWFIGEGAKTPEAALNNPVLGVPDQTQWEALRRFTVGEQYVNGERVTSIVTNNFAYAESDQRGGSQVQYLFSKDYDLTGKTSIYLSYHSMYEQNQDSMGSVEYSIDSGKTWLPVVIMIDGADVKLDANGKALGYETLIEPQGDTAKFTDAGGNDAGGYYGAFLGNQDTNTWKDLGPFISSRVNDDFTESKRVELFRLTKADNQKTVRLRFAQAGTGSWYFGVDDVGLYSITAVEKPVFTVQPAAVSRIAGLAASFKGTATGIGVTYQWNLNGNPIAGATTATYSIAKVSAADAGDYTLVASNAGGPVTSQTAKLTVVGSPEPLDLTPGLVAHLTFDDTYADASGNGVNGTAQGTKNQPTFEAGVIGKGVHITNKKDQSLDAYVSLGYPNALKFGDEVTGTDFTVSMWVKQISQADDQAFISNKDWNSSNNRGWGVFSQGGGVFRVNLTGPAGGTGKFDNKPAATLNDAAWHLVTVAVGRKGTVDSYVDGVLLSSASIVTAGSIDTDDLGKVVNIGQDGTGTYTDGGAAEIDMVVDDLGIWRRKLTSNEAAAIYLRGVAGKSLDQAPVGAPVAFTAPAVTPAGVVLNWTGGNGPFLVQGKLGVTDAWIDLQTTSDHTTTIPTASFAGFFRIVDGTTKTVKLFKASLNGANERPTAVTTTGTGTGLLALDGLKATYVVGYQGLTGAPVAYHLHGLGGADVAVGVKFALVPSGALGTSGLFVGQATVDQATADGIAAGQTYFNVHTAAFGGGEIRGQVVP